MSPSTHDVSSCDKRDVTIDILPDDVLLLIFYFDGQKPRNIGSRILLDSLLSNPSWPRLVHVCRRWRSVVLASPVFLDLKLVLTPGKRAELIDIWPPFPIILKIARMSSMTKEDGFDAAIVHRNRVRELDIFLERSRSGRLVSAMREPYPALIDLRIYDPYGFGPGLPDDFLGGPAPSLQHLYLCSVSFDALPKFLMSATGLVDLTLLDCRTHIPPDTILTCLAVLVNLKSFVIEYPRHVYDLHDEYIGYSWPLHWLQTRVVLPALTHFDFRWKSEYLYFFLPHIDTPLLDSFCIAIRQYGFGFNISELGPFLRRTTNFQALNEAHVDFRDDGILATSLPPERTSNEGPGLRISCEISYMESTLSSFFPSIYIVEHLYIYGPRDLLKLGADEIQDMQWLKIFQPFAAVKNLYLRKEIAQYIAPALQDLVGERVTNVFPILECIFLEGIEPSGPAEKAIEKFAAARRLLGSPVVVSHWNET